MFNGNTSSFELIEDYLKLPANKKILSENKLFEISAFLLMKENKDLFKVNQNAESDDLGRSTLTNLKRSALTNPAKSGILARSVIDKQELSIIPTNVQEEESTTKNADNSKQEFLEQNIGKFSNLVAQISTDGMCQNIIEEYIKALNQYVPKNEESLGKALGISRQMLCLLNSSKNKIDLSPYAERLKKAFSNFLDASAPDVAPNKKLFRFFDDILFKVGKNLDGSPNELRGKELWNKVLDRYFIISPALAKNNTKKVFKNLDLLKPKISQENIYKKDIFLESTGELELKVDFAPLNLIFEKNVKNLDKIILNMKRSIDGSDLSEALIVSVLESLTRSQQSCKALITSPLFDNLSQIVTFYSNFDDANKFKTLTNCLVNCMATSHSDPNLKSVINSKMHPDTLLAIYLDSIENNREDLIPQSIEALKYLHACLNNAGGFFDKQIPEKLIKWLGEPSSWTKEKLPALLLLAKLLGDPSLEQQSQKQLFFDTIMKQIDEAIIAKPQKIKNPEKVFPKVSDLSSEDKIQKVELCSYALGEYSKYSHNAGILAQVDGVTKVFDLYNAFEANDNDAIIATKIIEATRNGVYSLTDETMDNYPKEIDDIIERIPIKIVKFEEFELVPRYLQEILDFFQRRKKEKLEQIPLAASTMLSRVTESLIRSSVAAESKSEVKEEKQQVKDSKDLGEIYKHISEQLEKGPLDSDDGKLYEIANEELKSVLSNPNNQAIHTMFNLEIPKYLRLIANSPTSTMLQKDDALSLLNGFVQNPDILKKMLSDNFFVEKSADLIDKMKNLKTDVNQYTKQERDVLFKDLKFMKSLTDDDKGADIARNVDKDSFPLIDDLFSIIKNETNDADLKQKAIEILANLLEQGTHPDIEKRFLKEAPELFGKNYDVYPLLCALVKLMGVVANNGDQNKQQILDSGLLEFPKAALSRFPNGPLLNTNASLLVYNLSNEFAPSHIPILDSGIMPFLASSFNNAASDKELHKNVARSLLQIGYGSPEKKLRLVKFGFVAGLVPMLVIFSSPQHFDQEMCSVILKCMANFSTIQPGIEHLLSDGVIPAFRKFFNEYKEQLPEQNKLMMATVSNLAYEPKDNILDKIITDKGLELILDTLKFYTEKRDEETTEVCIDALTHVSADPKAVNYLTKTDAVNLLIDLLRQQLNGNLVYKSLRCLTKFSEHKELGDKIMEKGGHAAAVDIFKPYSNDMKNIFQTLKLLYGLVNTHEDKLEEFVFAGVPEKIISEFNQDWP